MTAKKINIETLEEEQRWANAIAPTLPETLRNIKNLQQLEGERQAQAWLRNEYYDLEDDEDASESRSD
jgi:hypothetical protein